jgi:arylsulfatase A-like enzyme
MDMAGVPALAGLDGQSLLPLAAGTAANPRQWALAEYHDSTCDTGSFMLRRGSWKYIAMPGYLPMLFDLGNDPEEVVNLAPSLPNVVDQLDAQLRSIVDYRAVDAKVKDYDRRSFAQWRRDRLSEGTYRKWMTRVYSGWDGITDEMAAAAVAAGGPVPGAPAELRPWSAADEEQIVRWLGEEKA